MQRWLVVLVLLVLAAGVWWMQRPTASSPGAELREPVAGRSEPATPPRVIEEAAPAPPPRISTVHRVSPERRAEIHRLILEGLARREAERAHESAIADEGPAPDEGREHDEGDVSPRALNDWNQQLMQSLEEDLKPLTDECFEAAVARTPDLDGFVELELTVVADEEYGGLIESVELGARNEATELEFVECIRESVLSVALPPPPYSGRRQIFMAKQFE